MNIVKNIWRKRRVFRSILYSIYFNFHYLPIKQAVKLPILVYKPHLLKCGGRVIIDCEKISTGMIQLGFPLVSLYPSSGIIWENKGKCVFRGKCNIGNSSAISIGSSGQVIIGTHFTASASLRLTSYCEITFGDRVFIGWDNIFMDTDFHLLTFLNGKGHNTPFAPISIGNDNWFGLKCVILKGTQTPDYSVIGGNSVLNRNYGSQPYGVWAGNPATLKKEGIYWNIDNDTINYV